jgi:hypothetical protein
MQAFERLDLLLLRAALLEAEAARPAWAELAGQLDLDTLDHGRMRLLPLLHQNLLRLGIEDHRLGRLRGIRHFHWARNQVRLRRLAPLLRDLRAEGVEMLLLKGAALLAATLPDFSLRPMDDIDLLVRPRQVAAAMRSLAARGYHPVNVHPWTVGAVLMDEGPGYPFANADGDQIDLHWHAMHLDCRPQADAGFWAEARAAQLFGTAVRVPRPADLLLQICAHASGWNVTHGLRWAADAAVILRAAGPAFDWGRFEAQAREHRLEAALLPHLAALRQHLDLPIPQATLRRLRRRSGPVSRYLATLSDRATADRRPWQRRLLALDAFRRSRDHLMHRSLLRALPSWLRHRCPSRSRAAWLALLGFQALGRPSWLRARLPIDRRLRPLEVARLPPLGTPLSPASPPAARAAFLEGWSYFEYDGRWTQGPEARLAWRLPPTPGDATLRLRGWIIRPARGRAPRVELWCGGRPLATLTAPPQGERADFAATVTVPAEWLQGQPALVLTFVVRDPVTPLDGGLGGDIRPLGYFLQSVTPVAG